MWGSKQRKTTSIDSLIGRNSSLNGDIDFIGGLHIDGRVEGNITAKDDQDAVVTISEHGEVKGEIHVPYVIINGHIAGDVHANKQVELACHARVEGNVYYHLIEMVRGAEVNGSLIHSENESLSRVEAKPEKDIQQVDTPLGSQTDGLVKT